MQLESHLAVGWLLANLAPGGGRRFRALVTFSALAPDLDGVSYLLGQDAYAHSHHIYGHNVFAGAVFTILCTALASRGSRRWMLLSATIGFASHWAGDYFLSGWPLMSFWPVSRTEVMFRPRIGLDHPINHVLSFASLIFLAASTWWWRRTVFESVWPAMDKLLSGLTLPRDKRCATCMARTAQTCDTCGAAVCLKHARVTRRLTVQCAECARAETSAASR